MDPRIGVLLAGFRLHEPLDAEESDAVDHLRRLLTLPGDPFLRTTLPAHVTASAVVVDTHGERVLLHLHRRLGRWLQPGGHVERGEDPSVAAVRETVEETGVAVHHPASGPKIVHLDEHPGPDGHVHLDLRYLLLADATAPRLAPGETTGDGSGASLRWATDDELAELTDRSLVRAVSALRRRGGPGPLGWS